MAEVLDNEDNDDFDFEGDRQKTTFFIHMIAGSIAGLMEHVAIYPVDTIKVIINNSDPHANISQKIKFLGNIENYIFKWWYYSLLAGFYVNWCRLRSCSFIVLFGL
jgi:hypothetical protein